MANGGNDETVIMRNVSARTRNKIRNARAEINRPRRPVDPITVTILGPGDNVVFQFPCFSDVEQTLTVVELKHMLQFFYDQRQPGGSIPFGSAVAKASLTGKPIYDGKGTL